jgi:hypothetical protein
MGAGTRLLISFQVEGGNTLDVCPAPLATGHEYLDKD